MKNIALAAFLISASGVVWAGAGACTFDQKAVASQLRRIAQRHPGFRNLPLDSAVQWVTPGRTVTLSYGGCEDLGAEVRVRSGARSGKPLSTSDLVAAVGRYWSPAQARALASALESGKLTRSIEGGQTVLEAPNSLSDEFPLGFTVTLSNHEVSVSWSIA